MFAAGPPTPAGAVWVMTKKALLPAEIENFSNDTVSNLSLPEQVYRLLREMIMMGRLQPGDRIVESKISKQLGLGQPTVRDALRRLESEGLVIYSRNRGCSVTEFSLREYEQTFRVRIELESLAAELGVANWSKQKSAELSAKVDEMLAAAAERNVERYYRGDMDFHRTLWKSADNPYLMRALVQITAPLFAFSMIRLMRDELLDLAFAAEEHRRIVDVMDRGDPHEARMVVKEVLSGFEQRARGIAEQVAAAAIHSNGIAAAHQLEG